MKDGILLVVIVFATISISLVSINSSEIKGINSFRFDSSNTTFFNSDSSVASVKAMPTVYPTKLYPNPVRTTATVDFFLHPGFRNNVSFVVYDYMGRKIKVLDNDYEYDASTAFASKYINVASIKTGAYYLVIDNGDEKRSIGFLVD